MRYIDFDGVILDTEDILFKKWRENPDRHKLPMSVKIQYIKDQDWNRILQESQVINDAIYLLKCLNPESSAIITKIHSLENEAKAKYNYLKKLGVKQKIIFVPYFMNKTDFVDARDNVLVDDSLHNLSLWYSHGGYPQFFDKKGNNIDSWGETNTQGFQRVRKIIEPRQ